jgi:hypothetical protein
MGQYRETGYEAATGSGQIKGLSNAVFFSLTPA